MRASDDQHDVAAIAVVDLARELKRHAVIDRTDIQTIDRQLADAVSALDQNQDVSGLMARRFPELWLIRLWQLADTRAGDTDVGARIGSTVSPEAQGLLASLMQHCADLGEVLETYRRNINLTNGSESWQILSKDGRAEMVFNFPPTKPYPRCAVERSMVALHQWGQYLCGRAIPLVAVEFSCPAPLYADRLRTLFACDVHFNRPRHALLAKDEIFSWPLPQRNKYLKTLLEQRIQDLGLVTDISEIEVRVRDLLRKDMPTYCNIDSLTNALCMSRATLYRKLKGVGTSFSKVLDEERLRLLNQNRHQPVARLCDVLGFHDVSATYKAFKRWGLSLPLKTHIGTDV